MRETSYKTLGSFMYGGQIRVVSWGRKKKKKKKRGGFCWLGGAREDNRKMNGTHLTKCVHFCFCPSFENENDWDLPLYWNGSAESPCEGETGDAALPLRLSCSLSACTLEPTGGALVVVESFFLAPIDPFLKRTSWRGVEIFVYSSKKKKKNAVRQSWVI